MRRPVNGLRTAFEQTEPLQHGVAAAPRPRARGVRQLKILTVLALLSLFLLLVTGQVQAQGAAGLAAAPGGLPLVVSQGPGGTNYSVPIQTLLFFTALGFVPAVLLLMTAFTRIVIVLGLLRQAMGTQAAPPNQVVLGLSLFLTFFVMTPTLDKIYDTAWAPYSAGTMPVDRALAEGVKPLREFMLKQTRQSDVQLFAKLARLPADIKGTDVPLTVLVPAFVTSELKSAFQIGFMIFIPFLIIDMIVASVLMSLGMMMLSPVLVALPFKLMLFVLADGWNLLLGSLAASFVT
jgi:flagellar biosynthesis protein FliP